MNIRKFINKNKEALWEMVLMVVFILVAIKFINAYYEKDTQEKLEILKNKENISISESLETPETTENYYNIESYSIEKTMRSFVKYCNNREIEKAYEMLTEECKRAMFPTIEEFETIYINNIYNIERRYQLTELDVDENKNFYQVRLYGNILETADTNKYIQQYYTFIEDENGKYKLNVNDYIYGENRDIKVTRDSITVKIGQIDVYKDYEEAQITITNNTSKTICLTGNKYVKNIYLQNSKDATYSSLNSRFDNEELTMQPGSVQTFKVRFNKTYNSNNQAKYLVLSDVILDYQDYMQSEDKDNYSNRTTIKINYQEK